MGSAHRIWSDEERSVAALNDPVLRPFLTARDEATRRLALERVLGGVAANAIARVLRASDIGAADADDVEATVMLRLIEKLEAARTSPDEAVVKLDEYVARLAFHALADVRREAAPERTRLKRRLRYIASSDPRLAAWDAPRGTLCGLAEWRDRVDARESLDVDPATAARCDEEWPGDALVALLRFANAPLPLDLATSVLAKLWLADEPGPRAVEVDGPVAAFETREELQLVWEEIRELPVPQRVALLLNLRDAAGLNAVVWFPLTGVAGFDDIAAAMEMTPEALTELWSRLPLPDAEIAATLGVARQQVINLRKAARARLQRRLAQRQKGRRR